MGMFRKSKSLSRIRWINDGHCDARVTVGIACRWRMYSMYYSNRWAGD